MLNMSTDQQSASHTNSCGSSTYASIHPRDPLTSSQQSQFQMRAQLLGGISEPSYGVPREPADLAFSNMDQPSLSSTPLTSSWFVPPPSGNVANTFGLPYTPSSATNHTTLSPLMANWSAPSESVPLSSSSASRPLGPERSWSTSSEQASALLMTPQTMAQSVPAPMSVSGSVQLQYMQISPDSGHEIHHHQPAIIPYRPQSYFASASMSAIPQNSFAPHPDRRLSSPVGFYRPYPLQPQHDPTSATSGQRIHPAPLGLDLTYDDARLDGKPVRFKPTREQLALLVASYDQNKNPDAAAREALARQLGPDVRSKTLQIWFQNRRSKSRAKERESIAIYHRSLSLGSDASISHGVAGSADPFATGGSSRKGSLVDMESLKEMVHDEDLRFMLPSVACMFTCWDSSMGVWAATGDFSGGLVDGGGKVEITGQRETLLPAFAKVHQYLYDAPLLTPVTFTHNQPSPPSPATPTPTTSTADACLPPRLSDSAITAQSAFASSWRFPVPATATTTNNTPVYSAAPRRHEIAGIRVRADGLGHAKQRSFSAPIAMPAEFEAGRVDFEMGSMVEEPNWGQTAATAHSWGGSTSVFGVQQQPYQQQQTFGSLPDAATGQSFLYGFPPSSVDYTTAPTSTMYSVSQPPYTSYQSPLSISMDTTGPVHSSDNSQPANSDFMPRPRSDSFPFSLQNLSSSSSMPPFLFDIENLIMENKGIRDGEMMNAEEVMRVGGPGMEVLEEY